MRPLYQRSTDLLPPTRRASAWRDWVHEAVVEMDFVPLSNAPFMSAIEICPLTAIAPHRVLGSPQRVTRSQAEIARGSKRALYLISQPTLPWGVRHAGHDHLVRPGQSVLVDSGEPYAFAFDRGLDDLSIELPPEWIERWLPDPARWLGVPLDVHTPWGRALRSFKEALVPAQLTALPLPDALIEDQLGVLLSLVTGQGPAPAGRPALLRRCIDAMQAQCVRPGLVAADVARQVGTSLRSLHRAFAAEGSSFAGTLTRLRVDEAARMLAARRFDSLSLAEVARRCGFADASHFARVFRHLRGASPSAYRAARAG